MSATVKKKTAFGVSTLRFGRNRAHPGLDPNGLYAKRPLACDPCLYSPQSLSEIFRVNRFKKINKDPWRYKAELEEWAQNLGYRNQRILESNAYYKSILGPAWHEVEWTPAYRAACKNVGFGRTQRFRRSKNKLPGPGTYYKENPFKALYGPHSTRLTMNREEPCRFKDSTPKWSLAPNRYNVLDKDSIENATNRTITKRGPYDLFTGKRDGSSIKNHFTRKRLMAATWPIALKGTLSKYDKSHFGKLNKTGRELPYMGRTALVDTAMCKRKPEDPGPATYPEDRPAPEIKKNKRAFNSSYDRGPGYQRVVVWPGVGRYSPKDVSCGLPGQGHRHVFLSKVDRTLGAILPQPMNSF